MPYVPSFVYLRWVVALLVIAATVGIVKTASFGDPAEAFRPGATSRDPLERVGVVGGTVPLYHSPFDAAGTRFITKVDEAVHVWDARTLRPVCKPLQHPGLDNVADVRGVYCISRDGKTVLTVAGDEIRLWDADTCQVRHATRTRGAEIRFAEVSPDGRSFVYVTEEARSIVYVLRIGEPGPARTFDHLGDSAVQSAQFDPTGKRLVTHAVLGPFRLWSTETGDLIRQIDSDDDHLTPYRPVFDVHHNRVLLPRRGGFEIVDCTSGVTKVFATLERGLHTTADIRFSTDGSKISVVAQRLPPRNLIQIVDGSTGGLLTEIGRGLSKCQLINSGRWAMCGHDSGFEGPKGELWDVNSKAVVQVIPDFYRQASPDGSILLCKVPGKQQTSVWHVRDANLATRP